MVGRFISEDPIGFGAGDTNIYRYVGNSPINEIDPSGLDSCDCAHGGEPSLLNRVFGGLRVIGGGIQTVSGVSIAAGGTVGSGGLAAAPSLIGGGLIAARGVDDVQAGLRQVFTGRETNTFTHDVVANVTGNCTLATVVDIGTGLISPGGAAKGAAAANEARAAAAAARTREAEAAAAAAKKVGCFVAGTLIQTRDGEKAIQDIQVGDWVLSDDPTTPGGIEYKQVVQTFNHETNYLVDVYIGGEKITTTEGHPFWVKDVGWVAARELSAGAQLETKSESWLGVDRVEKYIRLTTVYNFEVAGFHTYFVSDLAFLVHNECTEEFIQQARESLQNSPLRTQQENVSGVKIQRYVEQMRQGVDMGAIKVDGNIIVDGHHRYIASQIAGVELRQIPGVRPTFQINQPTNPIQNINILPIDY